jgi:hypothetical protein
MRKYRFFFLSERNARRTTKPATVDKWKEKRDLFAYEGVEQRGDDDGAVAAEAVIGERRAQQRQQLRDAVPGVDGRRRRRGSLPERARQVADQVERHAVEREPLRDLHRCDSRPSIGIKSRTSSSTAQVNNRRERD